jgi:hypothetical protein
MDLYIHSSIRLHVVVLNYMDNFTFNFYIYKRIEDIFRSIYHVSDVLCYAFSVLIFASRVFA